MKKETIEGLFEEFNAMTKIHNTWSQKEIEVARSMINIVLFNEFGKTLFDFFDVEKDKYVFKED